MANKGKVVMIYPYLSSSLQKRFKRYCKAHGHTESSVVETALNEYLDDTKDMTGVLIDNNEPSDVYSVTTIFLWRLLLSLFRTGTPISPS